MLADDLEAERFKTADLIGALASVVIATTGSMYLAAYSDRVVYLEPFGLSVEMFNISTQQLIASGAISLTFFSILFLLFVATTWLWGLAIRSSIAHRAAKKGTSPKRWNDRTILFLRRSLFVFGLLIFIVAGPGVGDWTGRTELARTQFLLEQRCTTGCFTYLTKDGAITGIKIAADPNRTAVATSSGVRLIENSSLRRVILYRPQRPL